MFIIDAFDETKQEDGEWFEFEGAEFLIASVESPKFIRTYERLQKPYKKSRSEISQETSLKLICEALADAVLLDWRNVYQSAAKKPVEYSKETAKQALIKNKKLREFVTEVAAEQDNYLRAEVAEVSGK